MASDWLGSKEAEEMAKSDPVLAADVLRWRGQMANTVQEKPATSMSGQNRSIWPDLCEILSGEPAEPPPWEAFQCARQVISVVEGVNSQTAARISGILETSEELKWTLNLGLQPAGLTTQESLRSLWECMRDKGERFMVFLYLPCHLRDHWPHHNLTLVEMVDKSWMASIGSSPTLGLAIPSEPCLNLWFRADRTVRHQARQFLAALTAVGVPLSESATEIPLLLPAEGSPEAQEIWREYESKVTGGENGRDLDDVEVTPDGDVVVRDPDGNPEPPPETPASVPETDPLFDYVSDVFDLVRHVIVGRAILPSAAPLKPEWLGVPSARTGRIKVRTSATIDLFDEDDRKALEKKRRITSELVTLLGYSISDGVRLVPKQSLPLLDGALEASEEEANKDLARLFGEDYAENPEEAVDRFLDSRRNAITEECRQKYKLFNPGAEDMPEDLVDKVMGVLRQRALDFLKKEIAAPYTCHPFEVDLHGDEPEDHQWALGSRFLEAVYRAPREFLRNEYGLRRLSGKGISIADYLVHLDFLGTDVFFRHPELVAWNKEGRFPPPGVAQMAEEQLETLGQLLEETEAPKEQARSLHRLLNPEEGE